MVVRSVLNLTLDVSPCRMGWNGNGMASPSFKNKNSEPSSPSTRPCRKMRHSLKFSPDVERWQQTLDSNSQRSTEPLMPRALIHKDTWPRTPLTTSKYIGHLRWGWPFTLPLVRWCIGPQPLTYNYCPTVNSNVSLFHRSPP